MNDQDYLATRQSRIEQVLNDSLPIASSAPQQLHQAMRYAVLSNGKRLRPLLVYATGETFGASLNQLDSAACAVELIHAYSLIHDDLPALDNDDFRRGQPSCHKAFDEATAILAGDALQALAFEVLTKDVNDNSSCLSMMTTLSKACSAMVSGQAMELAILQKIDVNELETIHRLKTGALMQASVQLGALAAQVDARQTQALNQYANYLGLAFQIQDDIQDAQSATPQQNYVAHLGLDPAKKRLQELQQQALNAIKSFGDNAKPLHLLANYMLS